MESINISELKIVGEGKTAVIYALGEDKIIKLFHEWMNDYLIENEMASAQLAYSFGINTAKVFDIQAFGSRKGIIYQRLPNINMEDLLTKRFWKAKEYGRNMAELHLKIHKVEASPLQHNLKEGYAKVISDKKGLTGEQKTKLLALLESLPDGNILCHGDFHPQNILFNEKTPFIIDWTASTAGHPMADVCGTYLIIRTAGTHKKLNKTERYITDAVLDNFLGEYLKVYFEQSVYTQEDLNIWMPVKAALYMDVGLPQECEDIFCRIIGGGIML